MIHVLCLLSIAKHNRNNSRIKEGGYIYSVYISFSAGVSVYLKAAIVLLQQEYIVCTSKPMILVTISFEELRNFENVIKANTSFLISSSFDKNTVN